jgi:hypothetical protein
MTGLASRFASKAMLLTIDGSHHPVDPMDRR